ncbi:right-handed parallel beta-helix repeat-containing protein [Methanobrevibacter cuticularis]|nr:Ig-like domain repeat protein [Methanobrevibacter cuticularis]
MNQLIKNSSMKEVYSKKGISKILCMVSTIIFILAVFSIIISNVSAATITVSPNTTTSADNHSINDAINAINPSTDLENTIILLEGTYNTDEDINNNITLNGNLRIVGNSSPDKVIIDGRSLGYLFNISPNSNVTFENITFKNGNSANGGAIYNNQGNVTISNSIFSNNKADADGGAINNKGHISVINSIFINNIATNGGAIYSTSNSNISWSNFTNNSQAIWISGSNNSILSSNILNNLNGIYINSNSNGTIVNYNRILNNTANGYDLDNYGNNTDANLNWWGVNNPSSSQIRNNGQNFIKDYWYVLQITLNNDKYLATASKNFTNDPGIYLAYNLSTNRPINNDPLKLAPFNVTVLCPFGNTFNRNIQTFSISWGTGTRWGLPLDNFNTYYSVQVFTDNEYILLEINYMISKIDTEDINGKVDKPIELVANLTNGTGGSIANKTVEFWINGLLIGTNKTNENGIAKYYYTPTKSGIFNFLVKFNEDSDYATSNASSNITIAEQNPKLEVYKTEGKIGEVLKLKAKLVDENGKPLKDKTVYFYLNGKLIGFSKTNDEGIATLSYIATKTGTFVLSAKFTEESKYLAKESKNSLVIVKTTKNNDNQNSSENINKSNIKDLNSPKASMKSTGNPIISILIMLLTTVLCLTCKKD